MRSLLLMCLFATIGQVGGLPQPPPRDARPAEQTGTASIQGRVTASDTGVPFRRATVMLGGPRTPRAVLSDDEGRYAFTGLPAGTYTISAAPGLHRAGYQPASYGAVSVGGNVTPRGKQIELSDGQKLENIDVALGRSALITGRVTDGSGQPAARVQVRAILLRAGAEPTVTSSASTNDLGEFRMFDLHPGEYLLMAAPGNNVGGPAVEGEPTGLAPSYAPGVPSLSEALRLRLAGGSEVNADIRLIETRVFTISGTVMTSSGEPAPGGSVSVVTRDAVLNGSFGTGVSGTGTFTLRNIPPGSYELIARPQAPRGAASPAVLPAGTVEFGSTAIELSSDMENVLIATSTGAVVRGEAVFDEALPAGGRFNVTALSTEARSFMGSPTVEIDGPQFTLKGVFGPVQLRANASGGSQAWALKAVLLRGRDITDETVTLTNGDSGHLQVVFTAKAPTVEGSVTREDGRPALESAIVIFGQDPKTWKPRSSFSRTTYVGKDGHFVVRGLREGRYYAAAIPPEVMSGVGQPTPEFLQGLSGMATMFTVSAGETRTLELRLLKFEKP